MLSDKVYIFKPAPGELGIPGLPHELSRAEAERLGVLELLKAAIEAGKYVEKRPAVVRTTQPAKESD